MLVAHLHREEFIESVDKIFVGIPRQGEDTLKHCLIATQLVVVFAIVTLIQLHQESVHASFDEMIKSNCTRDFGYCFIVKLTVTDPIVRTGLS